MYNISRGTLRYQSTSQIPIQVHIHNAIENARNQFEACGKIVHKCKFTGNHSGTPNGIDILIS
jgi:hypothetical protein